MGDTGHGRTEVGPAQERLPVSAVVVSYNRADVIGTCLRALAFADEVIVVDKSSTDGTARIAAALADRVIVVPWSPTVEETRAFAVAACSHGWIVCLDDDECLSLEAVRFIEAELAAPRADIYALPQRHYILGVHDERAYYWPEHQIRFFRRDAVAFRNTVHGGTVMLSDRLYRLPPEGGACIHHLSHRDVAQWLDKTNRYTSRPDRALADDGRRDLEAFAHARLDRWFTATDTHERDGYPAAMALLRATYDMVDRLKIWEAEAETDGTAAFRNLTAQLDAMYAGAIAGRPRAGSIAHAPSAAPPAPPQDDSGAVLGLRESLRHLRAMAEQAAAAGAREREAAAALLAEIRAGQDRACAAHREAEATLRRRCAALIRSARRRHGVARLQRDAAAGAALAQAEAQAGAARAEATHIAERLVAAREDALRGEHERANLQRLLERADHAAAADRQRLEAMLASECWALTAPIRFLARLVRRGLGAARAAGRISGRARRVITSKH